MKQIAVTDRLILREFCEHDAEGFYRLNLDPAVIRYTGDVAFESVKAAAKFIATYSEYHRHGFGRWSLLDKATGEYLGFCGLRRDTVSQDVDLGFRLRRAAWGKGIASEAARAAIAVGKQQYGIKKFVANAMRSNQASIILLERLEFARVERQDDDSLWLRFVLAY